MPEISIIIPAHNEEDYIRKTLHSIKNQTFQDFETIVVTNGCTDKTEDIVRKRSNVKFRHLSLPHANVSVARNAGALNAQSNILVFLDADTQLSSDALQQIRNEFTKGYSIASTKVKPEPQNFRFNLLMGIKSFYLSSGLYKSCSGALICRKEDFHKVSGFNPEIIVREHHGLISRLRKLGKYKCVDTHVTTSMRRFHQWGFGKAAIFWTKQLLKDKFNNLKDSEYEKIR
jgi:glycosyltransferase involved in cell wall biosynthesis